MRLLILWALMLVVSGTSFAGQMDEFIHLHQNGAGKLMMDNMDKKSITTTDKERIVAVIMAQHRSGLSTAPLVDKVNEGLQKNVSPDRIVNALEQVAARYGYAAQLSDNMRVTGNHRTVVRDELAHAMAAGLSMKDAGRIAEAVQSNKIDADKTVAVSSLAKTASRSGVPSKDVATLSVTCVEKSMSRGEIDAIRNAMRQTGRYGNASALARGYMNGINKGYRGGTLSGYAKGDGAGKGGQKGSGSGDGSGSSSGGSGNGGGGNGGGGNGNGGGGPR